MQGRGLIIAAPSSGSGKTTITLGLLRAFQRRGVAVRGAKSGPDYIDPRFHEAACGQPCNNLDAWAMTPERIRNDAAGDGLLVIEGAMGLFDGAPPLGAGATADLARILGLPVILVVDAARLSHSVAPLVQGFARFDPGVTVAGVILNRVGSDRHARMLRAALAVTGVPVLGAVRRAPGLALPDRHLGLVQAAEHPELEAFLDGAADAMEAQVDLDAVQAAAGALEVSPPRPRLGASPTAKRIAVARDAAFAFTYAQDLANWRQGGAQVTFFSPLADDPVPQADRVVLPGGYPELHAPRIAGNTTFLGSLRDAAQSADIYGECGGYMVLGETLIDAQGQAHQMAGLLGLTTSFAERKRHLGYRLLTSQSPQLHGRFRGHEFHYATTLRAEGAPLFEAENAEGTPLGPMGLVEGRVAGSFAHIIDAV